MKISEKMRAALTKGFPFVERAGIELLAMDKGYVKMRMPLSGNHNHIGTMYAGALFTLAEIPGGSVCFGAFDMRKYTLLLKDMKVEYKKLANTDITVEVNMTDDEAAQYAKQAEQKGKVDYVIVSEMKNTDGEIVAVARGTYQLRSK